MDSSDVWTVVQDTRPDDLVAITDPAPEIGPGYRRTPMGQIVYSAAWLGLPDGLPEGCTGAFDPSRPELGIQHDSEMICPVHEADDRLELIQGDGVVGEVVTAERASEAQLAAVVAPPRPVVCVVCKVAEDDHPEYDPDRDDEGHQFVPRRQDPVDARQLARQLATRPDKINGVIDIGFGSSRARSTPMGPTGRPAPVEALLVGGFFPEPLEQARRTVLDALAASVRAIRRYEQVSDDKGDRRILRQRRAEVEKIRTLFEEGDEG